MRKDSEIHSHMNRYQRDAQSIINTLEESRQALAGLSGVELERERKRQSYIIRNAGKKKPVFITGICCILIVLTLIICSIQYNKDSLIASPPIIASQNLSFNSSEAKQNEIQVSNPNSFTYAKISTEVIEVNLRHSPGYQNKTDNDVIVKIPSGSVVVLLSRSSSVDNLNWWYIHWGRYEGWIAESSRSGRKILELVNQ